MSFCAWARECISLWPQSHKSLCKAQQRTCSCSMPSKVQVERLGTGGSNVRLSPAYLASNSPVPALPCACALTHKAQGETGVGYGWRQGGLCIGKALNNPQHANEVLRDLFHGSASLLPPGGPAARQDQTLPTGLSCKNPFVFASLPRLSK